MQDVRLLFTRLCALLFTFALGLSVFMAAFSASALTVPDTQIEQYIEERTAGSASVALAVFNGEKTVYKTYRSHANIEAALPAGDDTVYEWGSVTKLLVWVSVMQQIERGQIGQTTRGFRRGGKLCCCVYPLYRSLCV